MLTWTEVLQLGGQTAVSQIATAPQRIEKGVEAWRAVLSPEAFQITRQKGTERPYNGAFCESFAPGRYACVCCATPLFDATRKFESGSGWPSFSQSLDDHLIQYHRDKSHGMDRMEVLCNICDAHLGHVFPDGPEPSGLRYCINSLALTKL